MAVVVGAVLAVVAGVRVARHLFAPGAPSAILASGRIEGRDVTIAPKGLQGRVVAVHADEGDTVTKDQLLAELEANDVQARVSALTAAIATVDVQIAQATLDVAFTGRTSAASIAAASAAASAAQARVVRAKAVEARAAADHQRALSLFRDAVISRYEFDAIETALETSRADQSAAEKDLARAEADLAQARASADAIGLKREQVRALQASRRAAEAQLAEAQSALAERRIVAPVDGTIISRPAEVGDVISPGAPVFTLVDLTRLYVKVYVPEPEIAKIRLGDPADVTVDAFPGRAFPARVSKIYDQAEFTPKNVETVDERLKLVFGVELAIVNPDRRLKPGMPADCVIHWRADGGAADRHVP